MYRFPHRVDNNKHHPNLHLLPYIFQTGFKAFHMIIFIIFYLITTVCIIYIFMTVYLSHW